MNLLTDKCKADFERWIIGRRYSILHDVGERQPNIIPLCEIKIFSQLDLSMKYGVIVDFFDSSGITVHGDSPTRSGEFEICVNGVAYISETRPEARRQAIIKASEIYNNSYLKQIKVNDHKSVN